MGIKGIDRVMRNLEFKLKDIAQTKSETAVYAVLSQGAAMAATMTPVDTSVLINSQTTPEITNGINSVEGKVGYTANYASYVHGASGRLKGLPRANKNGTYWHPQGEPRFLEKGFDQIKPHIGKILRGVYAK